MIDIDRGIGGDAKGVYQIDQGDAWADLHAGNFNALTGTALAENDRFVALTLTNFTSDKTLYLLLRTNAGEAVTLALQCTPDDRTLVLKNLLGMNNGQHVTHISIRGSAPNTLGRIVANFEKV